MKLFSLPKYLLWHIFSITCPKNKFIFIRRRDTNTFYEVVRCHKHTNSPIFNGHFQKSPNFEIKHSPAKMKTKQAPTVSPNFPTFMIIGVSKIHSQVYFVTNGLFRITERLQNYKFTRNLQNSVFHEYHLQICLHTNWSKKSEYIYSKSQRTL